MEIITQDRLKLIGYQSEFIPSEDLDYSKHGAYWCAIDFSKYRDYPIDSSIHGEIGVWVSQDSNKEKSTYVFGAIVDHQETVPEGFVEVTIPKGQYAVFAVNRNNGSGIVQSIQRTWKDIFKKELIESGLSYDDAGMCYEFYKGNNIQLMVPIKV